MSPGTRNRTPVSLNKATAAVPTPLQFEAWLRDARPGDVLEYYRGFLALDVASMARVHAEREALHTVAHGAAKAAGEDRVHLVQRRVGSGAFAYLVIKRPRGFTSLPAIDAGGGNLLDLRTVSARGVVA